MGAPVLIFQHIVTVLSFHRRIILRIVINSRNSLRISILAPVILDRFIVILMHLSVAVRATVSTKESNQTIFSVIVDT